MILAFCERRAKKKKRTGGKEKAGDCKVLSMVLKKESARNVSSCAGNARSADTNGYNLRGF